ncbi:ABC transporter permease [Egicoccus sp. AB-alg2]|uniref:ABC transporter permease n=1 Tax=Egicoccus sp. AB-alg2 TaxID=3242693 RepID=UPI00359EBEBE
MSTHALPGRGLRPGPDAWLQLGLAESRMVARDTSGLLVPIGMPVLIMVLAGLDAQEVVPGWGGMTVFDVYVVPLVLVMVVALVGVVNMPSFLATYRKTGVLRRLAVTPVHPAMVLVAQLLTSLVQTILGVAIALGVAATMFGLAAPRDLAAVVGVMTLATAAMYALGMLVAAVAPTPNASVALGLTIFFAIGATGGLFTSMEALPDAMASVGRVLPFGAAHESLQAAWLGQALPLTPLLALAATAVVAGALAAVWFRWDR